jgi:hypothetical protein
MRIDFMVADEKPQILDATEVLCAVHDGKRCGFDALPV